MTARKQDDAAKGDVEEQVDVAEDQGFVGTKVDPLPNEAHSLESGPDAPSAVEDDRSPVVQHPIGGVS